MRKIIGAMKAKEKAARTVGKKEKGAGGIEARL